MSFLLPFQTGGTFKIHDLTIACVFLSHMKRCGLRLLDHWEFPAVQWLGLGNFTARARVQSLVRELRSHKLSGMAKKKKKRKNTRPRILED